MLGRPEFGKTAVSTAIGAHLALRLQTNAPPEERFFLKVGQLDALHEARSLLREYVPVVVDDWTPSADTRRPSPDTVKKITDVTNPSTVQARFKDPTFARSQPRVFSSNASTPAAWLAGLPQDLAATDPASLTRLDPHLLAVLKRCAFCVVSGPMVPEETRAEYAAELKSSAVKRMRGC